MFGRRAFQKALHTHRATLIQRFVRGWLARVRYRRVIRGIVKLQSHYRRRKAKTQLRILKVCTLKIVFYIIINEGHMAAYGPVCLHEEIRNKIGKIPVHIL